MLNFLKSVVKSPYFKEVLRLLLAALAGASASGCGALPLGDAKSPAIEVFECQLAVFEAVVPAPVAEDLVMAARAGNFDYVVAQLQRLKLSGNDIKTLAAGYDECLFGDREPEADAEPLPTPVDVLRT